MRVFSARIYTCMTQVEYPEELIFCYSKHVFIKVRILDYANNNTPLSGLQTCISVFDTNDTSNEIKETRYTGADGYAIYDISSMLQTIMNNRRQETSNVLYNSDTFALWLMKSVSISLSFYDPDNNLRVISFSNTPFTVCNGAHDNIESWKIFQRRLKVWTHYPFTFDFPNVDYLVYKKPTDVSFSSKSGFLMSSSIRNQFVRYTLDKIYNGEDYLVVSTQVGKGISMIDGSLNNSSSNSNSYIFEFDKCERDVKKTYLRWLGQHGEIFYWLFNTVKEDTVVSREDYKLYASSDTFDRTNDTQRFRDNYIDSYIDTVNRKTLYSGMIDDAYYSVVSSIISSPCVDMFIDDDKWQRVKVLDTSLSRNIKSSDRAKTKSITLSIEIEQL